MKKIVSIFRRILLGDKFKHQYTCNPNFNIKRLENECEVLWKNKTIGKIKFAHTLQNKFRGNLFTIATGPSIVDFNLNTISPYQTISLNCAIKKFTAQKIKPTHCIIVDRRIFENEWDSVEASIMSGANCFFSFVGLSVICERKPELLKLGNIYLIESISRKFGIPRLNVDECKKLYKEDQDLRLDKNLVELCRSIGFSYSLKKGLFSGKTVATWATQLSLCLGYKNNFIVGMDLGGTGKKHFYATENNGTPDFIKDYEPHIRACFELTRDAYLEKNIGLYNLSEKSRLPDSIIKKITIEQALQIAHNSH